MIRMACLGSAAALAFSLPAAAQNYSYSGYGYDGYGYENQGYYQSNCDRERSSNQAAGTIVGAIAGGLIGAGDLERRIAVVQEGDVIDPQRRLQLQMMYAANTGRNFYEIIRCLDALRGMAIAVMVFVNAGGAPRLHTGHTPWDSNDAPLLHLADYACPGFVFCIGAAMGVALLRCHGAP